MKRAGVAAIFFALTAACAGAKPYRSDAPRNLRVLSTLEWGVSAELQIYSVGFGCETKDLGMLALDRPRLGVGVATGRPALLVVTFDTSSFFHGSRKVSSEVFFTPRPDTTYEAVVKYQSAMYEVSLREVGPRGTRELPQRGMESCKE